MRWPKSVSCSFHRSVKLIFFSFINLSGNKLMFVIASHCPSADYRCESRTGPLSCFASTNFRFVTRNHEK
jgi:hypothetical protein